MIYLWIFSFTCMLLLLLIYPSWELSILLIFILYWLAALYYCFVRDERWSRWNQIIFASLVISLWAIWAMLTMFGHIYLLNNVYASDDTHRIEWQSWWSVFLSGFVVDFRRNNALILLSWEQEYIIRDVPDVSSYYLGSQLLLSWYETEASRILVDNFRQRFLWKDHRSLPSLFVNWFDYDMWRMMKGYRSDIYVKWIINKWETDIWFLDKQKNHLRLRLREFSQDHLINALVLGMIIWDVSRMTEEQYDIYIRSGLVHIVAVSGGNMVLLVLMLSWLFFRLPYYVRLFLVTLCMAWYAFLCGLDSSVFRALIMWCLTLFTLFWWRSVHIYRSMSIAWFLILVYSPFALLYDMWFLLSFWALYSIVTLSRRFPLVSSNVFVRAIYQYLWITLAANIWVFPVLMLYMWQMNLLWFLWNILVLPIVSLVMILWALYTVLPIGIVTDFVSMIGTYIVWIIQEVAIHSADMHITLIATTVSSKLWILCLYVWVWVLLLLLSLYMRREMKQ